MSLRTRLIVSYIVIIIVALMLAFFTLILIARPIQARLATFQLAIESRQAAQRINSLYRQGASTPDILSRFETWAAQGNNITLMDYVEGQAARDDRDGFVLHIRHRRFSGASA